MNRPHAMDSAACWCQPNLYVPCTECEPVRYAGAASASLTKLPDDPGCWACTKGLRKITATEAAATTLCVVVVHW